nr:polyprotein [Husavirus sp.]
MNRRGAAGEHHRCSSTHELRSPACTDRRRSSENATSCSSSRAKGAVGFVPVGGVLQRNGKWNTCASKVYLPTHLYRGLAPPTDPSDYDDLVFIPWIVGGDPALKYGMGLKEFRDLIDRLATQADDPDGRELARKRSLFIYDVNSVQITEWRDSEDLTDEDHQWIYLIQRETDPKWVESMGVLRDAMTSYLSLVKVLVLINQRKLSVPPADIIQRLKTAIAYSSLVVQLTAAYIKSEYSNDEMKVDYLETIMHHALSEPEMIDYATCMWYYPMPAVAQGLADIFSDVLQYVTNWGKSAWECLCDYCSKVFSSLCGFFANCIDRHYGLVQSVISWLKDSMIQSVDPKGKFRKMLEGIDPKKWLREAYPLGLLIAGRLGVHFGFVSSELLTLALNKCVQMFKVYAESSTDWIMVVTAICGIAFSTFGDYDSRTFDSCVRPVMTAINLATCGTKLWSSILMVLPACLRRVLVRITGTDEDLAVEDVNDYVAESKASLSSQQHSHLFKGDVFLDRLSAVVRQGMDLLRRLSPKNPRWSAVNAEIHHWVLAHQSNRACRYANDRRAWPFWIHLFGAPGVGKSNVFDAIHESTLGKQFDPNTGRKLSARGKLWTRNTSQGFFNGYSPDFDYVVYDDLFNSTDNAQNSMLAMELQALCSSTPFNPVISSLEPGVAGMEGVQFESPILITANNRMGVPFSGDVERGLLHKRNLVVQFLSLDLYGEYFTAEGWKLRQTGEEEALLESGKYLNFIVKTPYKSNDEELDRVVILRSFRELVDYIITMQNDFAEQTIKVLGKREELDVEKLIERRIMQFKGIIPPTEEQAQAKDLKSSKVKFWDEKTGKKYISKAAFHFDELESGFEVHIDPKYFGVVTLQTIALTMNKTARVMFNRLKATLILFFKSHKLEGFSVTTIAPIVVEQLIDKDAAMVIPRGLPIKVLLRRGCDYSMFSSTHAQTAWLKNKLDGLSAASSEGGEESTATEDEIVEEKKDSIQREAEREEEEKMTLEQLQMRDRMFFEAIAIEEARPLIEKAAPLPLPDEARVEALGEKEAEQFDDFYSLPSCDSCELLHSSRKAADNLVIEYYKNFRERMAIDPFLEKVIEREQGFPVEESQLAEAKRDYKSWVKVSLACGVALYALSSTEQSIQCAFNSSTVIDTEYIELQGRMSDSPTASAKPKLPAFKIKRYVPKQKNVGVVTSPEVTAEAKKIVASTSIFDGVKTHGFFVKGRWFLTHKHLVMDAIEREPETVVMQRVSGGPEYVGKINYWKVSENEEKDLVIFQFECPQLGMFADCTNLIANRAMIERFLNQGKKWPVTMVVRDITYCGEAGPVPRQTYMCGMKEYISKELGYYFFATQAGDCGSPVTAIDKFTKLRQVMGFHVAAGNSGEGVRGYCQLFCREEINDMIAKADGADEVQKEFVVDNSIIAQAGVLVTPELEHPNLVKTEIVPRDRQVFNPKKSSFEPSPMMGHQPWEVKKVPSVVDVEDPRSAWQDPLLVSFQTLASLKQPEVDDVLLEQCAAELLCRYKERVQRLVFRRLSRQEAVGGIPGILNSVNFDSSPGYPLCLNPLGPGKRPYAWKEGEECHITNDFNMVCDDYLKYLLTGDADGREHNRLTFSKTELLTIALLEEHRTRAIYAGSFIHNTVGRELFGNLLVNINNHKGESFISCNQYSLDLGMMKAYLDEVKVSDESYIAGDYKNFDQHYVKKFQMKAYEILWGLMSDATWVSKATWDRFVDQEVNSPVQYGQYRYWFNTQHNSGCLFTTIVNNLVNSMMMRYMFGLKYGHMKYDSCVRGIFLGDDHVLCVDVKRCPEFNQQYLIDNFSKLGQIYTDDQKKTVDVAPFRRFEDITFLGSHPFKFSGLGWCGRMRKDTLEQNILYMKDLDSWRMALRAVAEHCPLWDEEYFNFWMHAVNSVLKENGIDEISMAYASRRTVALRTAESSSKPGLTAHAHSHYAETPDEQDQVVPLSMPVDGSGMGGNDQGFDEGTNAYLYKFDVVRPFCQMNRTCTDTHLVPFDFLPSKDLDLQATKMRSFQYMRADFEFRFQTNGNSFQQGMLVAYFLPLSKKAQIPLLEESTAFEPVMMRLVRSQDVQLDVPYRYPYPYLRTNAITGLKENENLGTLVIQVWSPLTYISGSEVTLTIYMRMKNPVFKVPRPYGVVGQALEAGDSAPAEKKDEAPSSGLSNIPEGTKPEKAEASSAPATAKKGPKKQWKKKNTGGGREVHWTRKAVQDKKKAAAAPQQAKAPSSKGKKKEKPLIVPWGPIAKQVKSRVLGGIPTKGGDMVNGKSEVKGHKNLLNEILDGIESLTFSDAQSRVSDIKVLTSALGVIEKTKGTGNNQKIESVFDGMSKCVGDHLTTDMQLAPNAIFRPGRVIMDPSELNFSVLFGKEVVVASFDWSMSSTENTALFSAKLDSNLCSSEKIVMKLLLQNFMFWRAKLKFKLYAMKTLFHTGRLRVCKEYGCDEADPNWRSSGYTDVLDFTTENDVVEFDVDWVSSPEYISSSYPGSTNAMIGGEDNYSMGMLVIEVANRLSVSNVNVSPSVNMILALSLDEVRVAVPRPNPMITCNTMSKGKSLPFWGFAKTSSAAETATPEAQTLSTSEGVDNVGSGVEIDGDDGEGMEGLLAGGDYLDLGAQFEFTVESVLDYNRPLYQCYKSGAAFIAGYKVYRIQVTPCINDLTWLYRGFSGSLSYHIFFFVKPRIHHVKICYVPSYLQDVDYSYGVVPPGTKVVADYSLCCKGAMASMAKEVLYPLSTTQQWIDVSVPYQQHTLFTPVSFSNGGLQYFSQIGQIMIVIPASKQDTVSIAYYVKYGDDATCGIFRTPLGYSSSNAADASYGNYV